MFNKLLGKFSHDLGIDLGTRNTLVYVADKGIVVNEPSVVAINKRTNEILEVGEAAKKMVGKTPGHIEAIKPLVDGVISDFEITEKMLKYFINKVHNENFTLISRPRVVIGIPLDLTEVEKKAVEDAARSAGARKVYLIEEAMAAAIGARLPVTEATATMIVDIGGGTSEIAVISLGGVVASTSVKVGGNRFDAAILEYIRKKHSLVIGERTAEEVKIKVGSALYLPDEEKLKMEINGRDAISGLPRTMIITSDDVTAAIQNELEEILSATKKILQKTPPELVADIIDKGIVISGGSALLRNIDQLFSRAIGVAAYIADDPLLCVAKGTGIALDNLDSYKRSILATK